MTARKRANNGTKKSPNLLNSEMLVKERVGKSLIMTREALGIPRSEWYETYGLYNSKLSQWENGLFFPPISFLITLCEDLDLSLDWFFRGIVPRKNVSVSKALESHIAAERGFSRAVAIPPIAAE